MNKLFEKSRFLVIVAVFGTLFCMMGLLVLGIYEIYSAVHWATTVGMEGATQRLVVFAMEVIDTFLIATVCYVITLGLYQLFIDPNVALPPWLSIKDFDDLKRRLIGVVIVILGVGFLAEVVDWDGERDLSRQGAAIALVIAALTLFLRAGGHGRQDSSVEQNRRVPEATPGSPRLK